MESSAHSGLRQVLCGVDDGPCPPTGLRIPTGGPLIQKQNFGWVDGRQDQGQVQPSALATESCALVSLLNLETPPSDGIYAAEQIPRSLPTAAVIVTPLTSRGIDVLRESRKDVSVATTAGSLHLAPGTVPHHTAAAMVKLGAGTRQEAADTAWTRVGSASAANCCVFVLSRGLRLSRSSGAGCL